MTVSLLHSFVNPASNLVGFTGTKPSDWNAQHNLTGLANSIAGFDGSGNALDGNLYWGAGILAGGTGAASSLTIESTTGAGTSDSIIFRTGSQVNAGAIDTNQRLIWGGTTSVFAHPVEIHRIGTNDPEIDIAQWGNNNTPCTIQGWKSRGGAINTQGIAAANDLPVQLLGSASDGAGFQPVGQFSIYVDGTPTANHMPGRVTISTNANGTALVEAVRVDSGQNVNIGNNGALITDTLGNSPTFQVSAGANDNVDLRRYSITAGNGATLIGVRSHNATIGINSTISSGDQLLALIGAGYDSTATPVQRQSALIQMTADAAATAGSVAGRITFSTSASGSGTPTEALHIDSSQKCTFAQGLIDTLTPSGTSVAWDGSTSGTITVATAANAAIAPKAATLIFITTISTSNLVDQGALYLLCAGGPSTLLAGGAAWVAPTTTPGAGSMSVADAGTTYNVYNNQGNSQTYRVWALRLTA